MFFFSLLIANGLMSQEELEKDLDIVLEVNYMMTWNGSMK